jgi:hypothetical protein
MVLSVNYGLVCTDVTQACVKQELNPAAIQRTPNLKLLGANWALALVEYA